MHLKKVDIHNIHGYLNEIDRSSIEVFDSKTKKTGIVSRAVENLESLE